jgi:hypothetical protein
MTSLVQDMYDGVKAMIKMEKELQGLSAPVEAPKPKAMGAPVKAGKQLKKPEDITGHLEFPQGTTSSLCKFLSKDIHKKYFNMKDACGVSFE